MLLLSHVEGSLEYLEFSLLNFNVFNTQVTYFLKYFRTKFCEILMSGSQEIGVFPRKQFHIQSQYFDLLRMRCI